MCFLIATRYCAAKQNAFGWDASGQSNLQELNIVLKRKFMIRRIKQQVLSELSEKARYNNLVEYRDDILMLVKKIIHIHLTDRGRKSLSTTLDFIMIKI